MANVPKRYNTDGFVDLTNAWKEFTAIADGASEKQIYMLAEDILKKLKKPVNKENMDIVIGTLMSQVKFEEK